MKKIRFFTASWCPHCFNAKKWLNELLEENPNYKNIDIEEIDTDNEKEKLVDVNFYYIPTFYVDSEKAFEGVPSKEIVKNVLESALQN